ncbi:hypothetical protein MO867_21660, partial [Microbulbifer sp. OS29]
SGRGSYLFRPLKLSEVLSERKTLAGCDKKPSPTNQAFRHLICRLKTSNRINGLSVKRRY